MRFGGILDTLTGRIVAPIDSPEYSGTYDGDPRVWYVGEKQADILLREDAVVTRILLYSAEGAGKTRLMAQWIVRQVILAAERGQSHMAGGATAPTAKRLGSLLKAVKEMASIDNPRERKRGSWGTHYVDDNEIRWASGFVVQLRATKKQSDTVGSPIQGYTWIFSADDELQDTAANGADPDIEARLRGARTSRRMCTATAKDSTDWRNFRKEKDASPDWGIEKLLFGDTPFVWGEHWERMRRNMSKREWRRRGLAEDVSPEMAVYYGWDRERNLRPLESFRFLEDATERVLSAFQSFQRPGAGFHLLIGHDPGEIRNTSIFLRCYLCAKPGGSIGERVLVWVVVGEFVTEQTTAADHGRQLRDHLRRTYGLEHGRVDWDPDVGMRKALVICDPHGRGEKHADLDTYHSFQKLGFDIFQASTEGPIKRRTRIEMVNRLLGDSNDDTVRLVVACDDDEQPLAPSVVAGFESLERDKSGRAENDKKGKADKTHGPVAVGYALWCFEREALTDYTLDAAGRPS